MKAEEEGEATPSSDTPQLSDRLIEFFKRAQAGEIKSTLDDEDEVKEVKPDLPQAGAKNFVCRLPPITERLSG